jgi:pimeloyl-ACP methyl ester carboxylesterase
MIDHARSRVLADADFPLHPRAAFIGFSAGGHFATRMAILHARRVLAVWAGGTGGHPILPLAQAQGFTLSYPVGVADLQEITGAPFDAASFKHVPIRLVQGALDTNSSLPTGSAPSDSYSAEQSTIAFKLLGDSPVERLGRAREFYRQVTERCETEVFPGAGHQMTPELVRDLANFIAGLAAP